jgi:hypothetical protein
MRVSGWSRLGVVLSILYGSAVLLFAYLERPRLEPLQNQWILAASKEIAEAISKVENQEVKPDTIRTSLMTKSVSENIAWLEIVATTPTQEQRVFAERIKIVNEQHKATISALPDVQYKFWIKAIVWWLVGSGLLFASGASIGWIYRGFRHPTV